MLATALLAVGFASFQLAALDYRQLRFPIAAVALYGTSAALFWWTVSVTRGKLAACGQGCISPEVITSGPYRWIRHPFYTSYNLTWMAALAATGWWPLAIPVIVMAALYERFAREEELGFSTGALADQHEAYTRRTGKYFPGLAFAAGKQTQRQARGPGPTNQ